MHAAAVTGCSGVGGESLNAAPPEGQHSLNKLLRRPNRSRTKEEHVNQCAQIQTGPPLAHAAAYVLGPGHTVTGAFGYALAALKSTLVVRLFG